ncbi:MAG: histidine kinase dimerization/phosphoacceptor domain -containing protein, partial [Salinibacter sp.]
YVRTGAGPLLQKIPGAAVLVTRSLWLVGGMVGIVLLTALLAGKWLVGSMQRSLGVLREAVEQVQAGRLGTQVQVHTDDELGRLAQSLNRMTTTLDRRTVSRSYLHAVLDSMAELLFVVDGEGRIRHANQAAADALGRSSDALRNSSLADYFDADPLASSDEGCFECTLSPPDGASFPVLVSCSSLEGADAGDEAVVCVAQDISDRKEMEEKLRRSLEEKEVLLREVHHRVKNNLQVISSLLHAQARDVDQADVRERFEESQDRIRSMATIHEQLYQSDNLARVAFDEYLETLTEELFRSYRTHHVSRSLEADAQALPIDQAIPAGLIVNELVSNSLEHAFPDDQGGTVSIVFRADTDEATLLVADDGVGTDALESDASLGLRLVRGLTRQLRGTLSVDTEDGVHARVTFPIPPSA